MTHSLATCPGVQGAGDAQHHEDDGGPAPARAAAVGLHDLLKQRFKILAENLA